jgi:hypothetical protein
MRACEEYVRTESATQADCGQVHPYVSACIRVLKRMQCQHMRHLLTPMTKVPRWAAPAFASSCLCGAVVGQLLLGWFGDRFGCVCVPSRC